MLRAVNVERWAQVYEAAGLEPFGPAQVRWRVSRDQWDDVESMMLTALGWPASVSFGRQRVFGWPLIVDEELPPNSIILEPAAT